MLRCQQCAVQLHKCSRKVDQMTILRISCVFIPVSPPTSPVADLNTGTSFPLPPVHLNQDSVISAASSYRFDAPGFESR